MDRRSSTEDINLVSRHVQWSPSPEQKTVIATAGEEKEDNESDMEESFITFDDDAQAAEASAAPTAVKEPCSPEERAKKIEMVRQAFKVFDSDHGGFIEKHELQNIMELVGLNPAGADDMAKEMNMDNNGRIYDKNFVKAFSEFIEYKWEPLPPPPEIIELDKKGRPKKKKNAKRRRKKGQTVMAASLEAIFDAIMRGEVVKLRSAFEAVDRDKSGDISFEEYKVVMASMGYDHLKDKTLQRMWREMDTDATGLVSFDEFIRFMCRRRRGLTGKTKQLASYFSVRNLDKMSEFMAESHIDPEESKRIIDSMPLLEKKACQYMKKNYRKMEFDQEDRHRRQAGNCVHILSMEERRAIRKVQMVTILLDMAIGAASAAVSGVAELFATNIWAVSGTEDLSTESSPYEGSLNLTERFVYYWLLVAAVAFVATAIEIIAIYVIHLRSVILISSITGLQLFPVDKYRSFVIAALARAALELPNPTKEDLGVNPMEGASKLRIAFAVLVYKAKTGLTTFALRLLFKRLLLRTAVKTLLFFFAIPVNMAWNALIGYKTLRAARIVCIGPSVAVEVMKELYNRFHAGLDHITREGLIRAVAVAIVSSRCMHPNHRILLGYVQDLVMIHLTPSEVVRLESEASAGAAEEAKRKEMMATRADSGNSITIEMPPQDSAGRALSSEEKGMNQDLLYDNVAHSGDDGADGKESRGGEDNDGDDGGNDEARGHIARTTSTRPPQRLQGKAVAVTSIERPGNLEMFLHLLREVEDQRKQILLLRVFAFALVLDGYIARRMIDAFVEACEIVGVSMHPWHLRWLAMRFIWGEFRTEDLEEMFDEGLRERHHVTGFCNRCSHIVDRVFLAMAC